jgi:hypothetical protein
VKVIIGLNFNAAAAQVGTDASGWISELGLGYDRHKYSFQIHKL